MKRDVHYIYLLRGVSSAPTRVHLFTCLWLMSIHLSLSSPAVYPAFYICPLAYPPVCLHLPATLHLPETRYEDAYQASWVLTCI